jgi:hypothetical protein
MRTVTHAVLTERNGGLHLVVRVKPRASKSRVLGVRDGALEVAVAAPPVDGEANTELVKTVARLFDLGKSSVRVSGGKTSRNKLLMLEGLSLAQATQRLSELGEQK